MNQRFKHILYLIILGLAFPQLLNAQKIDGAFIMSSVGLLQNMSNNMMAVSYNSNATCFNIQNGTAVIIGETGTGYFTMNCEINTKFNLLGIKLYPNPVTNSTRIKFINPPPLNDQFTISVWNLEGLKITSTKSTGNEIFQGIPLNLTMLPVGNFIIQIESDKYRDALKFIKAN